MTVLQVIRESFSLLSRRHQWLLVIITFFQMATGLLDVAGVMLLGVVGVLSVAAVSGVALPGQVQSIIDRLGWGGVDPVVLAAWLCLGAAVALVLKTVLSAILSRQTLLFLANRQADLSGRLTAGLLSRPLLEVMGKSSQDMAFVLTQGTQMATVGVLGSTSTAVADLTLLILLSAGLTAVDPTVTLFSIVFLGGVSLLVHRSLSRWARRMGHEATFVDIESYRAVSEALSSYREIMVSDRRGLYVKRIQDLRWQSASLSANTQFMASIPKYVFEVALVVGAVILAASQIATKDLAAAVGVVAVYLVAGSRVIPAVMRLQGSALAIRRAEAPATLAFDLARSLEAAPEPRPSLMSASEIRECLECGHPDFHPDLIVSDVWLTYWGTSSAALEGVSFTAIEGSSVALVGSTGAGKSTLADIVLGVVEPDEGWARIGGFEPSEAISKWPGGIAYVPQVVALANGTVRDNVALGLPREAIDDDWVWDALERAHLAAFLRDGREGLETLIGENGMRISGGQRQRLGVARALFTKPKLLVLDEATSALDAETEEAIARTMRDLEGQVTTVTIAHRLATVRHCDLVLFLEAGRVVGRGTFAEVREQSPAFDHQAQLLGL
jgi:ABC-type multidrug transport system fused ATPase/permease subunit